MNEQLQEIEATRIKIRQATMIEKARKGLLAFTTYTKDDYEINWHHRLVCNYLNKFIRKEIMFLMIWLPPRIGKSELCSRRLPPFYHGLFPNNNIMAASYSSSLANDMTSDVQRIMDSPEYRAIFPATSIPYADERDPIYHRNSEGHAIKNFRGKYMGQGVGGSFTGKGADLCFVGDTKVLTLSGKRKIKDIKPGDLVWSFSHEHNKPELRRVKAICNRPVSEVIRISTVDGREIICTAEHPIFIEGKGYTEAQSLNKGDWTWCLNENENSNLYFKMQSLYQRIREAALRVRQIIAQRTSRFLLWSRVFTKTSLIQESQGMQNVFCETNNIKDSKVLFNRMQAISENIKTNSVLVLQRGIQTTKQICKVLLNGMQKRSSLAINGWLRQFKFPAWQGKKNSLLQTIALNKSSRFKFVRSLFVASSAVYSSYRSQSLQRYARKLNHALRFLSYNPPQIQRDSVSLVERRSGETHTVYDIEVEGNHNFFANEILAHNCIIDDPIKSRKEADSVAYRDSVWKWYTNDLTTRLEKNGQILLVATRWHEDDLSGRILKLMKENTQAPQFTVLKLAAIREDLDFKEDPRQLGEALWPNKYPITALRAQEALDPRGFTALYQQRPTALEGGIIKASWLKFYVELPKKFDRMILSLDATFKDKPESDFVALQVWGTVGSQKYLVDQIRNRLGFTDTCSSVRILCARYPQIYTKLIEDAANGPAIIETLKKQGMGGIVPIPAKDSKYSRLYACSPQFEAGDIFYPDPSIAPWIHTNIDEILNFPNLAHDDTVDATSQALNYLEAKVASVPKVWTV